MSLVEKSRKGSDMTKNDIHHIYLSRIFFIKLNSSPFDYPAVIALLYMSFPDGSDDKESGCSAGDLGSILGSGRSPGEGNGYQTPVFLLREFCGHTMGLQRVGHN